MKSPGGASTNHLKRPIAMKANGSLRETKQLIRITIGETQRPWLL